MAKIFSGVQLLNKVHLGIHTSYFIHTSYDTNQVEDFQLLVSTFFAYEWA